MRGMVEVLLIPMVDQVVVDHRVQLHHMMVVVVVHMVMMVEKLAHSFGVVVAVVLVALQELQQQELVDWVYKMA
tara:strand:+ start:138 stop:359 length:222 start_codon:yes stop_codon:yes gene_type:complete